ncbi:coiled-coil domain-containing protein 9B isoform X2 [Megalobrama amblycephala]|uniref:coiled-coil domain-containing protein 9B isoform X2 n=1 Tax=Megalobrama amblycephala TaxID=75352 RepID=UPI00201454F0|nr:coiled-coil domain-containing protein 9B isoform X2 [Megalobrama amblycephala]
MQHQEHLFMFTDFYEDEHYLLQDEPHSPTEMMMMMKKEHKDAELDKKIEALRKKNEALMKRYQEVEEDKKRAEQEGMSLPCRKGKLDDLSITINKSSNDQRVVTKRPGGLREGEPEKDCDPGSSVFSIGRGKRRQLLVTMSGNIKGKRVFGERKDRNRPVSPARLKCSVEEEPETNARGKRPPSSKRVPEEDAGQQDHWSRCEGSHSVPVSTAIADLNIIASKEEQLEYLRWKKEREEIDRERVARHKNAKGQWRRAWDMDKADLMFSEKEHGGTSNRGGRNTRRGNLRSEESRGRHQASDRKGKSVPVTGSKAKGKDRLTGRARRWDAKEQEEHLQVYPDSSLQEFLEELDSLCAPESVNPETDIENTKPSEESFKTVGAVTSNGTADQNGRVSTEIAHSEPHSLKVTEKKVRFSENHDKIKSETETSALQVASLSTNGPVEENRQTLEQDDGECIQKEIKALSPEQENRLAELNPVTEGSATEPSCPESADVSISAEPGENQPVEHSKSCSSRGNEMDSNLSVLNLEPGDALPDHSTSADMARENGKVV